jgi:ribonuclease E
MEWGFESQESDDAYGEAEEQEARAESEADERRPRRRRRRGRRDERGEQRSREEPAGSVPNGEIDLAGHEPRHEEEVLDARQDVNGDIPGLGEQPPASLAEDERPGRRRRRGRRGGRRGRDRDAPLPGDAPAEADDAALEGAGAEAAPALAAEGPSAPAERHDVSAGSESADAHADAHEGTLGGDVGRERLEPQPLAAEGIGGAPVSEPRGEPGGTESGVEPRRASTEAGPAGYDAGTTCTEPEVAAPHAQPAPAGDPSPAEPTHTDPAADDPSRPARKGWWQRRPSGG